jgi:hypothetical protein
MFNKTASLCSDSCSPSPEYAAHHQTSNISPSELSKRLLNTERVEGAGLFKELIDEELEANITGTDLVK